MGKNYKIGTEESQAYLRDYTFAPKGYGFLEPGVVSTDNNNFVAYNIAKSFYQVHPEVFNLAYVEKVTGIKKEEVAKCLLKMYREHQIMLVFNPAVSIMGWGLYYWIVRLKKTATKADKEELTKWFQDNDQVCTGYMMEEGGDFDYYNGNHMRNIDNLVAGVIDKFKNRDFIDYVHICPTAVTDVLGTAKAAIEVYESCKELGKLFMMICQDGAECHEAIILLRDHGIPAYSTIEQAVDAMIALHKYGQLKK